MGKNTDKNIVIKSARNSMLLKNLKNANRHLALSSALPNQYPTRAPFKQLISRMMFIVLFFPLMAYADGETPVSKGLGYITDALTGGTGIAIATIALMGVSIACLFHYLEWKALLYTVAGIGGLFGAKTVVEAIQTLVK